MSKSVKSSLRKSIIIAGCSIIPVSVTHAIYHTSIKYDDGIRIACFIFSVIFMPVILFYSYKSMMDNSKRKKIAYFLVLVLQIFATILILDGEGAMLYKEFDGGEGMQVALGMLIFAYIVLGFCMLINGIHKRCRQK